jgi:hypothetical protein
MNNILSIDIAAQKFRTLKVGTAAINYADDVVELFYDDCLSPMLLTVKDYENLLDGHIVELHKGEVALVIEN